MNQRIMNTPSSTVECGMHSVPIEVLSRAKPIMVGPSACSFPSMAGKLEENGAERIVSTMFSAFLYYLTSLENVATDYF